MMLQDYLCKIPKEETYEFYKRLNNKPKEWDKITRKEMASYIISLYKEDSERIIDLCSLEEIQMLKSIIEGTVIKEDSGYIEYTILKNLENNYLLLKEEEYYIPKDILNYVKMALNIWDEKSHSLKDITDSVIIGLIRIHNAVKLEDFIELLASYYVNITKDNFKSYIKSNIKLVDKIAVKKYQKEVYVISLENYYYKDVITLKSKNYKAKVYRLEEVISIGKYKINLFKEELFNYLSFLEVHLASKYIDLILNELVIYGGFYLNDDATLRNIADNIEELYKETIKVVPYLPIWIYSGNTEVSLKENLILPNKNDPCICGSGKKFKHCCGKKKFL